MDKLPEKYLLQYIIKKTKKKYPTWQDVNELYIAKNQMVERMYAFDGKMDCFDNALERIKYDVEKIGVMVSFVHPDFSEMVAIGYSLCNRSAKDKFDFQITNLGDWEMGPVGYFKTPGFGFHIACGRAVDWGTRGVKQDKTYPVPSSIRKQFINFILRTRRYYKDKTAPKWIELFLMDEGIIWEKP